MHQLTQTYRSLLNVLVVFFLIVSVGVFSYSVGNRLSSDFNLVETAFKKTAAGEPIYSIDVRLPVFLSAFPLVRGEFLNEIEIYAKEVKRSAEDLYASDPKSALFPLNLSLYEVNRYGNHDIKGFYALLSSYTGGAHDVVVLLSTNYSVKGDTLISDEELLNMLGIGADYFLERLRAELSAEGYDKNFLDNGLDDLSKFAIHVNMYNSTNILELVFPPYVIAPYSEGTIKKAFSAAHFRLAK